MKRKITGKDVLGTNFISSMSDKQLKEVVRGLNRHDKKYVNFFAEDSSKVKREYKRRKLGKML